MRQRSSYPLSFLILVMIMLSIRFRITLSNKVLGVQQTRSLLITHPKPLIISSEKFLSHQSRGYEHPESPQRLKGCLAMAKRFADENKIVYREPLESTLPLAKKIINSVHDPKYVRKVEILCERGAPLVSPFDEDTFINQHSFNQSVLAQSAWIDAIDFILEDKETSESTTTPRIAFCLTRPPGHHAEYDQSMGFCLFNFAAGAARYAHDKGVKRVAILDYDVHFGNGISSLIDENTRYASLHQEKIFPYGRGGVEETGKHGNVQCTPLNSGVRWTEYEPLLRERAIPFLKDFNPEVLIISAGFDALSSDELAGLNLQPIDYKHISEIVKSEFPQVRGILFGLEGGYNIRELPVAVEYAITPFLPPVNTE